MTQKPSAASFQIPGIWDLHLGRKGVPTDRHDFLVHPFLEGSGVAPLGSKAQGIHPKLGDPDLQTFVVTEAVEQKVLASPYQSPER
jgi:hypothetical protein